MFGSARQGVAGNTHISLAYFTSKVNEFNKSFGVSSKRAAPCRFLLMFVNMYVNNYLHILESGDLRNRRGKLFFVKMHKTELYLLLKIILKQSFIWY